MKNIYVKNRAIGGTPVWYTTKDHKFNPGDFMGTTCCVLKRDSSSAGYTHLCADSDMADEGKLITLINIMNVLEEL